MIHEIIQVIQFHSICVGMSVISMIFGAFAFLMIYDVNDMKEISVRELSEN